jgi:hypothetical protein
MKNILEKKNIWSNEPNLYFISTLIHNTAFQQYQWNDLLDIWKSPFMALYKVDIVVDMAENQNDFQKNLSY